MVKGTKLQTYTAGCECSISFLPMQRFFIQDKLEIGSEGELPTDVAHQILHVLRMESGDCVVLLDNSGNEYESEIAMDGKKVVYTVKEERTNKYEPTMHVTLHQAVLKQQEKFELVLQKGTELGVSAFAPLVTERCQVQELRKRDRLERIVKEAAEQCERGRLPQLGAEAELQDALDTVNAHDTYLFFYEGLRDAGFSLPKLQGNVHIIIGPEGGFSESEVAQLQEICEKNENCYLVSLGKRVLRSETASIVALAHVLKDA